MKRGAMLFLLCSCGGDPVLEQVEALHGAPQVIATVLRAGDIAVDDDGVFVLQHSTDDVATDGAVVRVDAASGTATTLAGGLHDPAHLALDEDDVFFTIGGSVAFGSGSLERVAKSGGAPVVLATYDHSGAVAVDDTAAYFGGSPFHFTGGGIVESVDKVTGAVEHTYASGGPFAPIFPGALELDERHGYVVIADKTGSATLTRFAKDGSSSATLATLSSAPPAIAVGDHRVWLAGDGVRDVPAHGGAVHTLTPFGPRTTAIVEAGPFIYVIYAAKGSFITDGVARVHKHHGGVRILSHLDEPVALAIHRRFIYWTRASGEIVRVRR
jgi:hypothetical protein